MNLTDDRPLPDGLELNVLPKRHLAPVLYLQAHAPAPREQLGHAAVLALLERPSPGHRKHMEISPGELRRDVLL